MTAIMEKHRYQLGKRLQCTYIIVVHFSLVAFPKSPVVKMIVESKYWKQALRFSEIRDDCSDANDPNESMGYEQCSILQACIDPQLSNTAGKETTPFRELIKEMPGLL